MERTRLKLAVIFLLAALNVVLLGYVLLQAQQSKDYEDLTRRQAMTYLETHGVLLSESIIPWETDTTKIDLDTERTDDFGGDPIPAEGLPENCEVEDSRKTVTLLLDLVRGLSDWNASDTEVQSIETGYRYAGEGDRGVLTPMWKLETSGQSYYLNCATGEVTLPTE